MAKDSDLLKDKSVSAAKRQACLPAALLVRWEDGTCYTYQLIDADMKSAGNTWQVGCWLW